VLNILNILVSIVIAADMPKAVRRHGVVCTDLFQHLGQGQGQKFGLIPSLHDTTGCQDGLQPVVQTGLKTGLTTGKRDFKVNAKAESWHH